MLTNHVDESKINNANKQGFLLKQQYKSAKCFAAEIERTFTLYSEWLLMRSAIMRDIV